MDPITSTSRPLRTVAATLLVWLLLAVAVGASGQLQRLQPPAPQVVLLLLTLGTLAALWFFRPISTWATAVDPRWFVSFHFTRFVGIYFLVLYERGELPFAFAVPGGWGDIAVAAVAVLLVIAGAPHGRRRGAYVAWNVLGLVDILFVVATATRLAIADPQSMAALLRLPLSLLPTFVVPIVIATHIWLFKRLVATTGQRAAA